MTQANLKDQLGLLIQLQALDSEIYTLNNEKAAKPEELKSLDAAHELKKQKLASLEKTYLDLQKQKKDRELELATKEESAKKLQAQLFQLKTNKEYQVMLQQIADTKADGSMVEEKILESMEQIDKIKAEIDQEKKVLQEEEKVLNAEKTKVSARIKEIDDRAAQLQAQAKQVSPGIDPKILSQYQRILANRDGLAIVMVKNDSCQGCNMSMPAQVINLIKMYEHIVTCEMCNRILYVGD